MRTGHARERAFTVIDLTFLARREFQAVELRRILLAQTTGEALDAVVAGGEAKLVYQAW